MVNSEILVQIHWTLSWVHLCIFTIYQKTQHMAAVFPIARPQGNLNDLELVSSAVLYWQHFRNRWVDFILLISVSERFIWLKLRSGWGKIHRNILTYIYLKPSTAHSHKWKPFMHHEILGILNFGSQKLDPSISRHWLLIICWTVAWKPFERKEQC